MKWVAYMPLRGGSKGIPGKNWRLIAGKPLFAWGLEAALDSGIFDSVWAGTDSDVCAAAVEHYFKGRVGVFRRSPETCTDEASTEDAMVEFAAAVPFDVLATVQATSPMTTSVDFRAARRLFLQRGADSLVTGTRLKRFLWVENDARPYPTAWAPLNHELGRRPRRQEFDGVLMENGAFYFTSRQILESQRFRLGGRVAFYEMMPDHDVEADEKDDWTILELRLARRQLTQRGKTM